MIVVGRERERSKTGGRVTTIYCNARAREERFVNT